MVDHSHPLTHPRGPSGTESGAVTVERHARTVPTPPPEHIPGTLAHVKTVVVVVGDTHSEGTGTKSVV